MSLSTSHDAPDRDNPTAQALTDPEVIDLRVLTKHLLGNPAKVPELAQLFLDTAHEALLDMDLALARGDATRLRALCHRTRSGAEAVGARGFARLCLQLETACTADAVTQGAPLVTALHQRLASITAALDRGLPSRRGGESQP